MNFVFASLFVFINFLLMQFLFNFIAEYYGLQVKIEDIIVKKTIRQYSHFKKEVIERVKTLPLNYILTILFGILTNGLLFPITVSLKFMAIESKRIGKAKSLDPSFWEKIKIIFFGLFGLWLIYTILKQPAAQISIISAYVYYTYKFLLIFTISSIIPFGMLLAPIIVKKFGYEFITNFIGDILIFSNKSVYASTIITIVFLPIFSLFLDPILFTVFILIVYAIVWLRIKYLAEVSQ